MSFNLINPYFFPAPGCSGNIISTTSLYEYFKFEQNGIDSSGNGRNLLANNLTYSNTIKKFGYSGRLSASTSYFSGQTYAPTGDMSIAFWAYPTKLVYFVTSTTSGALDFAMTTGNKVVIDRKGVENIATGTNGLNLNNWNHVVFNYNNTSGYYEIYLNGSLDKSGTTTASVKQISSGTHFIGNNTSSAAYCDYIDDLSIWSRQLTSSEISTLYSSTCPLSGA